MKSIYHPKTVKIIQSMKGKNKSLKEISEKADVSYRHAWKTIAELQKMDLVRHNGVGWELNWRGGFVKKRLNQIDNMIEPAEALF